MRMNNPNQIKPSVSSQLISSSGTTVGQDSRKHLRVRQTMTSSVSNRSQKKINGVPYSQSTTNIPGNDSSTMKSRIHLNVSSRKNAGHNMANKVVKNEKDFNSIYPYTGKKTTEIENIVTHLKSKQIRLTTNKPPENELRRLIQERLKVMEETPSTRVIPETREPLINFHDRYIVGSVIGSGTYGQVMNGIHVPSKEKVAIKKILMKSEQDGFPRTTLREIKILKSCRHDNLVSLREFCFSIEKDSIEFYLIMDLADHDLAGLINQFKSKFTVVMKLAILKQLLIALEYIHFNHIYHRDLKTANILIKSNGRLLLADFGLARIVKNVETLTNGVVTLWYRPPELLYGCMKYTDKIDMWGVGCIGAEMWHGSAIMRGSSIIEQLKHIHHSCEKIKKDNWPKIDQMPNYKKLNTQWKDERLPNFIDWKKRFENKEILSFIKKCLTIDPDKRLSAKEALEETIFTNIGEKHMKSLGTMLQSLQTNCFELVPEKRLKRKNSHDRNDAKRKHQHNRNHLNSSNSSEKMSDIQPIPSNYHIHEDMGGITSSSNSGKIYCFKSFNFLIRVPDVHSQSHLISQRPNLVFDLS
ncbi:hypothetical protein SNEBB_003853 [Seison nebaliae]|nr:hypothetical protein SNEBB_003853 [Seison nebaliae]